MFLIVSVFDKKKKKNQLANHLIFNRQRKETKQERVLQKQEKLTLSEHVC